MKIFHCAYTADYDQLFSYSYLFTCAIEISSVTGPLQRQCYPTIAIGEKDSHESLSQLIKPCASLSSHACQWLQLTMNPVSFYRMIATELGLCSSMWRQTTITQFLLEIQLADLTNKSPYALTALNNKIYMHNRYDTHLIIFTVYSFSCVNFSQIQLTLKIYYHQKFPDLWYTCVIRNFTRDTDSTKLWQQFCLPTIFILADLLCKQPICQCFLIAKGFGQQLTKGLCYIIVTDYWQVT